VTRLPRLSIFARTFLLMLCALVISAAIGFAVLVLRPPAQTSGVRVIDLIAVLHPDRQPNGAFGPPGMGPAPGMPQAPDMGRFTPPPADVDISVSAQPPKALRSYDANASSRMTKRLSLILNVPSDALRVYIADASVDSRGDVGPPGTVIDGGFAIGVRQADGLWRIVSKPAETFPSIFEQELLWLFGLGLLVLLPIAWLFARTLAAPIRQFADAAERLGSDANAPPVPRHGPREMLRAVDSFNAMQARINRMMQERTHMIGAIAHDLRTPLARLSFRLDGLPSPLGEKVEADIQEMKTMISAALDFIHDRSLGLHKQRLDFRLLVESVADDLVDVGHDVVVQAGPAITLEGDPVALRRAVVNLVENGLKYGERVRMYPRTADSECLLEIDDDGPGIPDALQRQVFEPFFRMEASRNRGTGGIGLGLATVRAIVFDHGGTVELRNRKDGGLRVVMALPLAAR
jgi:two-component system OmpR family sensor kinase